MADNSVPILAGILYLKNLSGFQFFFKSSTTGHNTRSLGLAIEKKKIVCLYVCLWRYRHFCWLQLICGATNFLLLETTLGHSAWQGRSSNFSRFLFRLRFSKTLVQYLSCIPALITCTLGLLGQDIQLPSPKNFLPASVAGGQRGYLVQVLKHQKGQEGYVHYFPALAPAGRARCLAPCWGWREASCRLASSYITSVQCQSYFWAFRRKRMMCWGHPGNWKQSSIFSGTCIFFKIFKSYVQGQRKANFFEKICLTELFLGPGGAKKM